MTVCGRKCIVLLFYCSASYCSIVLLSTHLLPSNCTDNYCEERDFRKFYVFVPLFLRFCLCRVGSRVGFSRWFRISRSRAVFPGPSSLSSLFVFSCGRFPVLFVACIAGFRFGLVWVKVFHL